MLADEDLQKPELGFDVLVLRILLRHGDAVFPLGTPRGMAKNKTEPCHWKGRRLRASQDTFSLATNSCSLVDGVSSVVNSRRQPKEKNDNVAWF